MEGRHMCQNLGSTVTRLPANDLGQLKVLSSSQRTGVLEISQYPFANFVLSVIRASR